MHAKWLRTTLSTRDTSDSSARAPMTPPPAHAAKPKAVSAQAGAKADKPPTGATAAGKASEVRETNPASPTGAIGAAAQTETIHGTNDVGCKCVDGSLALTEWLPVSMLVLVRYTTAATTPDAPFTWQDAQEYYLFPLLLACYTRHGTAAEAALQGLAQCFDAGLFDDDDTAAAASCRLDVIVDAVASICHQGVKARFALALPFFRKVGPMMLARVIVLRLALGDPPVRRLTH